MNSVVEDVVTQAVAASGLELVELRRVGTRSRPVLDVRVDRPDGQRVTVGDCARASRAIEERLDASDLIAQRYVLEVSSPGVERRLRTTAEWRRFVGREVSVTSTSLGGRIDATLVAVEGTDGAEEVTLRDAKGVEHRVPLGEIREARLVFHWK
jgi:ribosome maturation factor RimP